MTVLTATVKTLTGAPSVQPWNFSSAFRHAEDGSIITRSVTTAIPVDGILTVDLEPGPATVKTAGLATVQITVPDEDTDLWDLIAEGVAPNTSSQTLADAIAAYFEDNPVGGGVDLSNIPDLHLIRVAMGTLNDSGISIPNVGELVANRLTALGDESHEANVVLDNGGGVVWKWFNNGNFGIYCDTTATGPFIVYNGAADGSVTIASNTVYIGTKLDVSGDVVIEDGALKIGNATLTAADLTALLALL